MKKTWFVCFLIVFLAVTFLSYKSYENRIYDWDMPGYLGCIYSWENGNQQQVHQQVYNDIQREASPLEYEDIKGLVNPNKAIQFFEKDTQAFYEQLPYYDIKVLYNVGIWLLYKTGISGPKSVLFVSIISYFLTGMLLFFILQSIFINYPIISAISTIAVMALPPIVHMSETPTPDMMVFLFLMLFFLSLIKKKPLLCYLSLILMIITRPDYILLGVTFLIFKIGYEKLILKKNNIVPSILAMVAITVLHLGIINYYDYPGWRAVFYDTFIYRRPLMSAQAPDFTVSEYLSILFDKLINFKKITLTVIILLGGIFYWSKTTEPKLFAVFITFNLYLKFLFFPDSAVLRFHIGFVILLLLTFLYVIHQRFLLKTNPQTLN